MLLLYRNATVMGSLSILLVVLFATCHIRTGLAQITTFIVPEHKANWFDAAKYCYEKGWMLAAIMGADEERRVTAFAQRNSPTGWLNPRFWVAENDQEEDAEFCPQITLESYFEGENDCMEMLYFVCESLE
nr:uncharacterized protein LOC109418965 [Aedes albopictus]